MQLRDHSAGPRVVDFAYEARVQMLRTQQLQKRRFRIGIGDDHAPTDRFASVQLDAAGFVVGYNDPCDARAGTNHHAGRSGGLGQCAAQPTHPADGLRQPAAPVDGLLR